ncbi:MAG: PRC-barrel domain-containing protein [Actinobacteria bacterium]|nr:PRC-barrel domain-containing protein [Actinomycetota bacterium]
MKKTQQVLGLPVIEISSGEQMGSVSGIVVSPDQGKVEYLLLDRLSWYGDLRAIPFEAVLGIGEFAVTVSKGDEVFPVSAKADLVSLLERNVQVIKAGVMTKSGKYVGTVSEFTLDSRTGKILGCEIVTEDGGGFVAPGEKVITFGAKFLVVEDGYEDYSENDLNKSKAAPAEKKPEPVKTAAKAQNAASADPVEVFEARQRQYLAGKKAAKKIVGTGGQVIINEGEIITEETIENALAADKYIELTMNVSD